MCSTTTRNEILIGVDGSTESDAAVTWATREAIMRQLPIRLLHAVDPVITGCPAVPLYTDMLQWQEENAQIVIEKACKSVAARLGESKLPDVRSEVLVSHVASALIDASKHARMLVVGAQGMGALGRLLMGSVSTNLVHHAHCPVAVIHTDRELAPESNAPVVVGIDGSPASEPATALAFDEASRRGVPLVAVHAWSDVGVFRILGMDWRDRERQGQEVLAERLAGWQEQYPDVRVKRLLFCDKPAWWLLKESEHGQLVVVGSRGRGGFPGMLLGSVGSAVAQSSTV